MCVSGRAIGFAIAGKVDVQLRGEADMQKSATKFGPPPSTDFTVTPSAAEVQFFSDHGYLVVERITTDEEIAWLRRIFEFLFDPARPKDRSSPVDRSGRLAEGEPSRLQQAFFPELEFPELLAAAHMKNARRYAAALLDVDETSLSSWAHMILKPPGGRPALWHQDHAYWQPEFDYVALGCWLPLHDVSVDMGAMQFIPGSHRRGLLPHHHADDPAFNVLEVDAPFDVSTAVACPLPAGGATFHHSETLHYTAPNTTREPRLAYPVEFQTDPVRRAVPDDMPWMEAYRAATGGGSKAFQVADGRMIER
jgi:ectoine hydroxylase-related dioxygenase (phytanoyl-CoA dioxygenase family)